MNSSFDLTGVEGKITRKFEFDPRVVSSKAVIVASVTEVRVPDTPFLGEANNMMIKNIVPHDDGSVEVVIDTDWTGGPISIRVSFIINPG